MRCEPCRGTGLQLERGPAAYRNIRPAGIVPCPACGGSGIASCCEGAVGGPAEATNGTPPKGLLRWRGAFEATGDDDGWPE